MAEVKLSPTPRRSCEQSLAFRATVSPPHLRRILPRPALPPSTTPTPAQLLRQLLDQLRSPRASVYRRLAQQALDDNDAQAIARATRDVQTEIDRCRTEAEKLHRLLPKLYPKPAAA